MVFERILVAYDGWEPSEEGLRFAIELAAAIGCEVTVLHVAVPGEMPPKPEPEGDVPGGATNLAEWLEQVCRSRSGASGVTLASEVVEHARTATAIEEVATRIGADLIVAGRSGRHGLQTALFGTTAERLVRRAPCSTAVFSAGFAASSPSHVMVGHDGSELADRGLHIAARLASALSAALLIIHAVDYRIPFAEYPPTAVRDALREHGEDVLRGATSVLSEPLEAVQTELREGDHRAALLTAATERRPRLLVVTDRGRGGYVGMLLGSTARDVASSATCPVLVART